MPRDLLAEKPKSAPRDLLADQNGGLPSAETLREMRPGVSSFSDIPDVFGSVINEWGKFIQETPERAAVFSRNAVDSVPVVGPLVSKGVNEVAAQARSAIHSENVQQSRDTIAGREQALNDKHAEAQMAGKITGTIAPLVAAGSTATGAKFLGNSGPLLARIGFGAGSGSTLSGADTLARTGDVKSSLVNALIGGVVGGGAPVVSKGVDSVIDALSAQRASPAARMIFNDLNADRIPIDEVTARIDALGPYGTLADLGENLKTRTGALAATQGPQQSIVRDTLSDRSKSSASRITSMLDDTLGKAQTPSAVSAEIKAAQKALSSDYEKAFANSSRVDTKAIADNLDSMAVNLRGKAQDVAKSLRKAINVVGSSELDPNPRTLFAVRNAIDGMFDTVTDGNALRVLSDVRSQVDDVLRQTVPGIKVVDAKYEELAKQAKAFDRGQQVLSSGRTSPRPTELADEFALGTSGQQLRMSQGARDEIERIVGTQANDVSALNKLIKGDGDWNRSRLTTLFGPEKANKVFDIVERERLFASTANTVMGNSETARRASAMAEVNPQAAQLSKSGKTLIDLLMKPAQMASNTATKMRSSQVNSDLAEALMSNKVAPELIDQLYLAARNARQGSVPPSALPLLIDSMRGNR